MWEKLGLKVNYMFSIKKVRNNFCQKKSMKVSQPIMQFTSDSTLSGLLEVIIAKSQGSSSFRKSGIELLKDQLGETSEMRNHRLKSTSDRDIEEWISILNKTAEMLEDELESRLM